MKITILGSGASIGAPLIFNHWKNPNIDKNEPKNYRTRSSFYLNDKYKKMLVEMGPDCYQQINKNNIPYTESLFLSHNHQDHIGGVWEVENIKRHLNKTMNIYCNMETLDGLMQRFPWLFDEDMQNYFNQHRTLKDLVGNKTIIEGKYNRFFKVYPYESYDNLLILPVIHGKLNGIGFKYKNFVFTPDLNILPDISKGHIQNADLWILQCNNLNISDYTNESHTDLKLALKMIEELQPKRAILTHLTDEIDYAEVGKMLPKNVELAFDGMEIEV
ncbi:MAG: MBL fold metallo-hydrolase [Rickettsiales bacterium]|nr:MAG: MBL fold metallo-hydrolase [Rickettsiales bacterium]